MITLLLGPYGHGKSTYILNKIEDDCKCGTKSILIVPEQQTVISERELASLLPPSAQLLTEATNFTRLANSVFRQVGGLRYNYVTKAEKNLIMYQTLCEVRETLKHYKIPKGREKSCISLFLQAIGELKSYSISILELENAMRDLDDPLLKERIGDMLSVWSTYDTLLKSAFDDPYDDILMLEKKLGECDYFKDCNVYLDSFYGFTKSQLNVVYRILEGAKNVTIALDCPHDAVSDAMQYKKIVATKNAILKICSALKKETRIIPFETDYKHVSGDIAHLVKNMWTFDALPKSECADITLANASDEFEECEYTASKIKELILKGERYSSIAVIARNSSTYQGIIDFCLDKYNIPYHFSAPSKLLSKPVIKMIFSAINAIGTMRSEDIVRYAKCGYLDIDEFDLSYFENYIYRWSIYGKKFKNDDYWGANPEGYVAGFTDEQAKLLSKILAVREKILKNLSILEKPFISGGTVKDCALGVYEFLVAHDIQKKLNKEIKIEKAEEAQELTQVWDALIRALNSIVKICGDAKCDSDTFLTLLNYAMMDAKIGTIPTGEDKVTIADASLVRAKNIKHVFVLGVNEGTFPAIIDDNSFFSDRDKIALETVNIDLSAKSDERGDDELLFFKNSIAVASHSATVIALKTDVNGNKKEPSIAFTRIKSLFENIKEIDISSLPVEDMIFTPSMAKELYGSARSELKEAIKQAVEINSVFDGFKNENDVLCKETAQKIFGGKLYLSKSSIETFVKCRFNYYCKYVLGLKESEKIKFSHNDIGTLVHAIFEHFLKLDRVERKSYTDEEILEIVTRLTDEYTNNVCGVHALSQRMRHFFSRLKGTICVFVKSLLEEMSKSKFTPEFFELSINGNGISSPLPLEFSINESTSVIMTGVADRVDICRQDGTTYIKIFDYKTGNYNFKLSKINDGLDMQMLIYLLALCNMQESDFKNELMQLTTKIEPAGLVFISYDINSTKISSEIDLRSEDAAKNEGDALIKKVSRNGLELDCEDLLPSDDKFKLKKNSYISTQDFDDIFQLVKSTIAKIGLDMISGEAQACPMESENPCRYCKNASICRSKREDTNE